MLIVVNLPSLPPCQHYLNDLAQFGIFPTRSQPANVPTSSASSRLSTSPALGSPISAPRSFSFGDGGGGDGGASQLQPALTSMDGGAVASAAAAAAAVLHQVNANAAVAAAAVDTAAVSVSTEFHYYVQEQHQQLLTTTCPSSSLCSVLVWSRLSAAAAGREKMQLKGEGRPH